MAKFLAYYNLSSISNPNEFLGTAPDGDENNVIATLSKNMVVVINVKTQATVRSWTSVEKLSTKVVYDAYSKLYVGVFAQRNMRCWNENCADINKIKKLRFQNPIADILIADKDLYVMYTNGTCQLFESAMQTRLTQDDEYDEQITKGKTILDAKISGFADKRILLTYIELDKQAKSMVLVRVPLYDSGEPTRFKLDRSNLNVQLAGYTVYEGDETPMLWTVWSDQRVFIMSLTDSVEPESSPGIYVAMLRDLNLDKPVVAVGVTRNCVAIYGANVSQEGASLLLYNTQYKVINARQFFKVHLDTTRLFADQQHIYLAMAQYLSIVIFHQTNELLAELVGIQCNNDYDKMVQMDNLDEEEVLNDSLNYVREHEVVEVSTDEAKTMNYVDNNCKEQSADGLTVPFENADIFYEELREDMSNEMQVELLTQADSAEIPKFQLMSNRKDNGFYTPQIEMISGIMERSGASEHEITEKLLTVLVKADQFDEIDRCLLRYSNISDKALAIVLHYLLVKLEKLNDASDTNLEAKPGRSNVTRVLDLLLSCSFHENGIACHLRKEINESKIYILLEYLHEAITNHDVELLRNFSANPDSLHFEMQIFRWFGLILSTHFQKLILNSEEKLMSMLLKWRDVFKLYQKDWGSLQGTATLLYSLAQRRKAYQEKSSCKWYSIEEIYYYKK